MSYKKLVNFFIFIISILSVNLITTYLTDWLFQYRFTAHPAKATLIGMGAVVFILYPAFNWLDEISEKFTKKFFKAGKNTGGRFFGLLFAFIIALTVLFLFYIHLWFGWSPLKVFKAIA